MRRWVGPVLFRFRGPQPAPQDAAVVRSLLVVVALLLTALQVTGQVPATSERRTSILQIPFTITRPGYYFLVQDVVGDTGISIGSSDVTLDLNGFEVVGLLSQGSGIEVNVERENVVIMNGRVRNWQGHGIDATKAVNSHLIDVSARRNGGTGLLLGRNGRISGSMARLNRIHGVQVGTGAVVTETVARDNGLDGIVADTGASVLRSTAQLNGEDGIQIARGASVRSCLAELNGNDGIEGSDDGRIVSNVCRANGRRGETSGAGLRVGGSSNVLVDNQIEDNEHGLVVRGRGNQILRNRVKRNGDNYDIIRGNDIELLVGELPETLEWPCTATLEGPLTGVAGEAGLVVAADDVTIDLAGHGLVGVRGSLDGIVVEAGRGHLVVRNGTLSLWDRNGINASVASGPVLIEDVAATDNGRFGFWTADDVDFRECHASSNGRFVAEREVERAGGIVTGARATLVDCSASANVGMGIQAGPGSTLRDCIVRGNGSSGIQVARLGVLRECTSSFNERDGIVLGPGSTVAACVASGNGRHGILISSRCHVTSNDAGDNGVDVEGAGIRVTGTRNRVEDNGVSGNGFGLHVTGRGNVVVGNTAAGNVVDFELDAGNTVGRIVDVGASGNIPPDPRANVVH